MVVAPTGVAAVNVSGCTAHSFFRLPVNAPLRPLSGDSLTALQEKCDGIQYYIFDEISMVGAKTLNAIDQRLRQAHPSHSDTYFGSRNLIFFGDFGQLPPVGDKSLYSTPESRLLPAQQGCAAYRTFDACTFLTQPVRQQNDPLFCSALQHLRNGQTTIEDYDLFSTRFTGTAPAFDLSSHLYPTRDAVLEHNLKGNFPGVKALSHWLVHHIV